MDHDRPAAYRCVRKCLNQANFPEEASDDLGFVTEPLFGSAKFGFELVETPTAEVLHLYVFEPVPDPLIRIRGIAWQLLQVEPTGGSPGKKAADLRAPMGWEPVPDHRQPSRYLPKNVAKKLRLLPSRRSNPRRRACRALRPV